MEQCVINDVRSAYASVQIWQEWGDRSWHLTLVQGPVHDPSIADHVCYGPFASLSDVLEEAHLRVALILAEQSTV